ncbi:MAG TPA: TIGR04086 family membrane protein [Candidatus Scatosoma pullicola]|nr:TIGR04086 family membrane protein [Candidatus Scatosoma pullicola]
MRSENSALFQIVKGTGIAVLFALVATVLFSFILRLTPVPDSVIMPVDQCIKALAVLFGCLFSLRGEKGWLKGLAVGMLTVALTGFVFSAVARDFSFSLILLAEFAFGAVAGLLSGIVAVNLRSA